MRRNNASFLGVIDQTTHHRSPFEWSDRPQCAPSGRRHQGSIAHTAAYSVHHIIIHATRCVLTRTLQLAASRVHNPCSQSTIHASNVTTIIYTIQSTHSLSPSLLITASHPQNAAPPFNRDTHTDTSQIGIPVDYLQRGCVATAVQYTTQLILSRLSIRC
jgi:hypothetical protein